MELVRRSLISDMTYVYIEIKMYTCMGSWFELKTAFSYMHDTSKTIFK